MTLRHNLYKLREEREMKPLTFLNAVCSLLCEKRYLRFASAAFLWFCLIA